MIRLEGSLGLQLARIEDRHDAYRWRIVRLLGLMLVTIGAFYWFAVLAGLTQLQPVWLGLAQMVVGIAILGGLVELYYHEHLLRVLPPRTLANLAGQPDWIQTVNLADYASRELARVLAGSSRPPALVPASGTGPAGGGSYDMQAFLRSLLEQPSARQILLRAGLVDGLTQTNGDQSPTLPQAIDGVEPLLQYAAVEAASGSHYHIQLSHVLVALLEHYQPFADLLFTHKVAKDDLLASIDWFVRVRVVDRHHFFWERGKVGIWGIGRDWAAGYTPTLGRYARDLSMYLRDRDLQTQIVGRDDEISQVEAALASQRRANVLLVGLPGVGKKTIVNGLAARIASGDVPRSLANKHVFELDVNRLLASSNSSLEDRLLHVLSDAAHAGNIILFIDNIHTLFAAAYGKVGTINATEILLPFLQSGRVQLIGATTPADYHSVLAVQGAVAGSFTRVDIDEPSDAEALVLLGNVALYLEAQQAVLITVPVLRRSIAMARRYVHKTPIPESAIRVLEAALIAAANRKATVVSTDDVDVVVSRMSRVPVGDATRDEKDRLLNLEAILHERVIGQDEAIAAVASALRRARAGVTSTKRPIGSFLFVGPTGVGKTETAKALAAAYFGSDQTMIRLDMSEFQSPSSLARLIGAPTEVQAAGPGALASAVRDNPFSLVLLDEIEKAHPDVLNLFLQVLEDGRATDGRGELVDFTNTIIIATSNAGSDFIRQQVKAGVASDQFKEQLLETLQREGTFRPEFLNRFDAVVTYQPLSEAQLLTIVDLQLGSLNARLREQGIQVALTDDAKATLARLGYQPEFGARALRRVLQDKVENGIADRLLKGEVARGQTVTLDVGDIQAER